MASSRAQKFSSDHIDGTPPKKKKATNFVAPDLKTVGYKGVREAGHGPKVPGTEPDQFLYVTKDPVSFTDTGTKADPSLTSRFERLAVTGKKTSSGFIPEHLNGIAMPVPGPAERLLIFHDGANKVYSETSSVTVNKAGSISSGNYGKTSWDG